MNIFETSPITIKPAVLISGERGYCIDNHDAAEKFSQMPHDEYFRLIQELNILKAKYGHFAHFSMPAIQKMGETEVFYFDKLERFGKEVSKEDPRFSRPIIPAEYKPYFMKSFQIDTSDFFPYGTSREYSDLYLVVRTVYKAHNEVESQLGNRYLPNEFLLKINLAEGSPQVEAGESNPVPLMTVRAIADQTTLTTEEMQDHLFNNAVQTLKDYIYSDHFEQILHDAFKPKFYCGYHGNVKCNKGNCDACDFCSDCGCNCAEAES